MIRFVGRSLDTYQVKEKSILQGYKYFALGEAEYIRDWMFTFSIDGIAELETVPEQSSTPFMMLQMLRKLSNSPYYYRLYMDNFFNTPKPFIALKEIAINVYGTLRKNQLPRDHVPNVPVNWNEASGLTLHQTSNLQYIIWQDCNAVHIMSTFHTHTDRFDKLRRLSHSPIQSMIDYF